MARKQCNTCQGEYEEFSADGVPYFHACPPVTVVRARDSRGVVVEQPISAFAGRTIAASEEAKQQLVNGGADAASIVVELARWPEPRKNHRDENTLRRDGDRGQVRVIKSEGGGSKTIPDRVKAPAERGDRF